MKKYSLKDIYFLYDTNGAIIFPFVYNRSHTKIMALPKEICIEFQKTEKSDGAQESAPEALIRTIADKYMLDSKPIIIEHISTLMIKNKINPLSLCSLLDRLYIEVYNRFNPPIGYMQIVDDLLDNKTVNTRMINTMINEVKYNLHRNHSNNTNKSKQKVKNDVRNF